MTEQRGLELGHESYVEGWSASVLFLLMFAIIVHEITATTGGLLKETHTQMNWSDKQNHERTKKVGL